MSWRAAIVALLLAAAGCGESDEPAPLPADFALSIDRRFCFGPCPEYSASVDASGLVTYVGERYVRESGRRFGQVEPAALRRRLAHVERIGFFGLEDEYWYQGRNCPQRITDTSR
jgi:hypothetical protein